MRIATLIFMTSRGVTRVVAKGSSNRLLKSVVDTAGMMMTLGRARIVEVLVLRKTARRFEHANTSTQARKTGQ